MIARCIQLGLVAIIAAGAGCVRDELLDCENGVTCPAGLVCDLAHEGCVTPDQLTACEGKADLEPCLVDSVCHEGVCLPIGCGNGRVDPGEACDDGNLASADGCAGDCSSTETCGNGTIDPVNREDCDDGNLTSHDGCDSACAREQPVWMQVVQASQHPDRWAFAAAYDEARGRLVVFGGQDTAGTRTGTTFEWDGERRTWLDHRVPVAPTARYGSAMVYDAARGVIVLFGGNDIGGPVTDTWLWDGARWSSPPGGTAPPERMYHCLAYDSRRRRVLLFGGRGGDGTVLGDLWAWDGATWTELTPAMQPPPREHAVMAYDPTRDQIVLTGGFDPSQPIGSRSLLDTWIFDGESWRLGPRLPAPIATPDLPYSRIASKMAFDPVRGGIVLVGSNTAIAPGTLLFTDAWQVLDAGSAFDNREDAGVYFDPALGTVVAGLGEIDGVLQRDLYRLDATWTPLAATPPPPQLAAPAMTYDAIRGRVVAFGGREGGTTPRDRTYELERDSWVEVVPGTRPPARANAAMAYDAERGRSVLWGPDDATSVWEWNGASWTRIDPPGASPAARTGYQLAHARADRATILFGGLVGTTPASDTWAWNGTAWQDLGGGTTPAARELHGMAYDEARAEIVMFGGRDAGQNRLADTWTWTRAGGWVQRSPPLSPSARVNPTMTWDPARARVVMFGGGIAGEPLDETWEWDGATWSRLPIAVRPPPTNEATIAYDARAHTVVVFGGPTGSSWRLRWAGRGPDDACELGLDLDGDGRAACADADCGPWCTPLCAPLTSCGSPACGDGTCDALETCRLCPDDCGACTPRCGDSFCDPAEVCAGDCP